MKFKIATLGCRTNQYESQAYRTQLLRKGYREAEEDEAADLYIVNTCTVTASADQRSRYQIRQLQRENPQARILVTGCSAERAPEEFLAMQGVTDVIPNAGKEALLPQVFPEEEWPEFSIESFAAHTRAFVKVQDGCNSFCTYCIIPYVRGRSRSRPLAEIIHEVEDLVASGYQEIVLTGINIGDFDGGGDELRLADLVRIVDAIPGVRRLRISSIDPDEVDDDLLDAVIQGQHTCHSMHIVLQSGSNVVLKRMNRKYTRQEFYAATDRLLAAAPDFTFTTDVIVGFPGETEADFAETLAVLERVEFAHVHMFPYSDRPRTRAATYTDKITPELQRQRKQRLLQEAERASYRLRERFVGKTMTILTEQEDPLRPHEIAGHTDNFLKVWIPKEGLKANQLVHVLLEENTPEGFVGRILNADLVEKVS